MKITAGAQHTFWHSNAPGVQNSSNTTEVWELMTFYLKIGQKENENCTFCQEDTDITAYLSDMPQNILLLEKSVRMAEKYKFNARYFHTSKQHCIWSEAKHFHLTIGYF